MRAYLLLLLCIGSVRLCLAQDILTHVEARVRECGNQDAGCRWTASGRMLLEFEPIGSEISIAHRRIVRRGGRVEIDLPPGRYYVRAYPPGRIVSPGIVHVSSVRRRFIFTSRPMPIDDAGPIGGGKDVSSCRITGCNGELCATSDVASSCNWSPAFSCLRSRRCVRAERGGCEWRDPPSIARCMDKRLG